MAATLQKTLAISPIFLTFFATSRTQFLLTYAEDLIVDGIAQIVENATRLHDARIDNFIIRVQFIPPDGDQPRMTQEGEVLRKICFRDTDDALQLLDGALADLEQIQNFQALWICEDFVHFCISAIRIFRKR